MNVPRALVTAVKFVSICLVATPVIVNQDITWTLMATLVMVSDNCVTLLQIFMLYLMTDINECDNVNGGCEQNCINDDGSYTCSCTSGFHLSTDRQNCTGMP